MKMPISPPPLPSLMKRLSSHHGAKVLGAIVNAGIGAAPDGIYRHWDTLRFLTPPTGLSLEDWWLAIKMARLSSSRSLPLKRNFGAGTFTFAMPDCAFERCHAIDRDASGRIALSEEVASPATRDQYIVNSLMEEAITSSQLEGAATTRTVAREMIRSGRPPRDRDERMILNNFRAMNHVRGLVGRPFSTPHVFALHRILTEGTLDEPDTAGRFRHAGEEVVVGDRSDGSTLHTPPPSDELPARMEAMIRFAGGDGDPQGFVHPVIRSILLHFWLAYDHPFVDGNGRTARALFYWSMLNHGYWLTEYLSISTILRKAPARYIRSFLYCETDDNDATYFILSQMAVIQRAIEDLSAYLRRKMAERREVEALVRRSAHVFNHRQLALLTHAQKHAGAEYTVAGHAMSHAISYESARLDLAGLEKRRLLVRRKIGKTIFFAGADGLAQRLKRL